ncbi:carbohydrate porin [Novosphingobium huizhouense]|uniref:carbohydrate porin n=1 Tax=Novosphingobium huizhouense TaxID=2866625 RepID=UPI001CD83C0E|nr:carbohydrate porin [Novosphingobium huizhouense]
MKPFAALVAACVALCCAEPARSAQAGQDAGESGAATAPGRAVELAAALTVDVVAAVRGGADHRARVLSNLDLTADLDLDALAGWSGARGFVYVLDNHGLRPNDAAGTLEGVNNIEVGRAATRLFEAWIEQDLGRGANLRVGLYDLNSEFYVTDSSGLLLGPPFGIGSEFASTGRNGPSIFPSSALAARLSLPLGKDGGFVRMAVLDARAQTFGDVGGVDLHFGDGLLFIGEAGKAKGATRLAVGAWGYSRGAPNFYLAGADGEPVRKPSYGGYAMVEHDLPLGEARKLTAFVRAGVASPDSAPFRGALQAGVLLAPALKARPESLFSIGFHQAWTNRNFRAAARAEGVVPANEQGIEATYADSVLPWLSLQPDVQWVRHPGGDRQARSALILSLRTTASF